MKTAKENYVFVFNRRGFYHLCIKIGEKEKRFTLRTKDKKEANGLGAIVKKKALQMGLIKRADVVSPIIKYLEKLETKGKQSI